MKRVFASILFLVILCFLSCKESGNIASSGDHLFLTANPPQISFNGTSSLTVTGTDENGAPLPDGTVVSFRVNEAGRISPNSVQLLSGAATATYFATHSAGDIMVTATSGSVQASTTVTVADNIAQNVFVSANPATFPAGGGTSLIGAVVTDDSGTPLEDIGVDFSTTAGELQSGGAPIQTNKNGFAIDTLNTTSNATVTATTEDGFSGQTTVLVGVGRVVCHMTVSTSTPTLGQPVLLFDTSDDPGAQIVSYHWDFGDATSANGQNVQHTYGTEGTFNVVHSVTDAHSNTIFCDPFPLMVSR